MESGDLEFSVLLPTYAGDDPDELTIAIESLLNQTQEPDEILVIKDGPLPEELGITIEEFANDYRSKFSVVQIPENRGLGNALRTGVEAANNTLVARMDADDISVPTRFETQLDYFTANPETDIVGGYIEEFETDPGDPIARREVPTSHSDIERIARFRSPKNHGTVMFNRSAVLDAGNYRPVDRMEDYDLWARMLLNGAKFANIPEVLVRVRAGDELYGRRGGLEYAREEIQLQLAFYKWGFTSLPVFAFNTTTRTGLRLLPNSMRGIIYRYLAR